MLYFSYGMNTNKLQMSNRCPTAVSFGVAKLPGFEFRFAGHADIVPNRNSTVDGVLWNIDQNCLDSLDVLEGYPFYYNRKQVTVEFNGQRKRAHVYFMNPGNPNDKPSDNYLNLVLEGYNQHGVSTQQIDDFLTRYSDTFDSLYQENISVAFLRHQIFDAVLG